MDSEERLAAHAACHQETAAADLAGETISDPMAEAWEAENDPF